MAIIYIAGPMTGLKDFNRDSFNLAERALKAQGHEVRNPACLGTDWSKYQDYIEVGLVMLRQCEAICFLPGSEHSEGAQIEIIHTGTKPVAWNASADVTVIRSATSLEVANFSYGTTSRDVSFFQAGDKVDYLPRGNHDGAITGLEIDSISGNVITFTAAHGIASLNGTLEPTTYANASATHRSDAYLANTSDIINTTVDAQEYS